MKLLRIFKGYRRLEETLRETQYALDKTENEKRETHQLISRFFMQEIIIEKLAIDWRLLSLSAYGLGYVGEFKQLIERFDKEKEQREFEAKVRAVKCKKK